LSQKSGKIKPLLQAEMVKHNGKVVDTSAGKELKAQLEEDIDFITSQLHDHKKDRPPESYRRSKDPAKRRAWREWEDEKQDLMQKLELKQSQLKKLGGIVVSTGKPHSTKLK
jgi:hypothetical protein